MTQSGRVRTTALLLAALACCPAVSAVAFGNRDISGLRAAVVKIYVTTQDHDYATPWQSSAPAQASGTGFVISKRRILTNAHVVSNTRYIEVKKDTDPRRYRARVLHRGHDCDLAVLTVNDPAFFEDTRPVKFATVLPKLSDTVTVLGYPMGGERLSLTKGVVSRIDFAVYSHSGVDQHLVLQVDAAINPGNSGGPVLYGGRVVGLAFQGLARGDNIGYAIPNPVLQRFLTDIEDGTYNGYQELGAGVMDLRNAALRTALGLPQAQSGVVVYYLDPFGCAKDCLRLGDVLLAIDGHDIAEDGTIQLEDNVIEFSELLERKQWGESVTLRVWRAHAMQDIRVPLETPFDPYIFRNLYDRKPEYVMVGGLVFSPLTREYLRTQGERLSGNIGQELLYYMQYAKIDGAYVGRDEFVVLSARLPHAVNTYGDGFVNAVVERVNDQPITRLTDVRTAIASRTTGFHVFEFAGLDDRLVLDAQATAQATADVMRQYAVPAAVHIGGPNDAP
jgi:S1-C subfamily serine protease